MENFPGTIIKANEKDVVSFLDGLFCLNEINQNQLMAVTGLSQSTIQNWVNRGWVAKSNGKGYDKDKVARILIINTLRNALSLNDISALLYYINGKTESKEDDIISESALYITLCRIIFDDRFSQTDFSLLIDEKLSKSGSFTAEERERLKRGLSILIRAVIISKGLEEIAEEMKIISDYDAINE